MSLANTSLVDLSWGKIYSVQLWPLSLVGGMGMAAVGFWRGRWLQPAGASCRRSAREHFPPPACDLLAAVSSSIYQVQGSVQDAGGPWPLPCWTLLGASLCLVVLRGYWELREKMLWDLCDSLSSLGLYGPSC